MSEQGSLRYKKAKTALQEAQERLITNHMLDSANACQQGVEHISTLEAEIERLREALWGFVNHLSVQWNHPYECKRAEKALEPVKEEGEVHE